MMGPKECPVVLAPEQPDLLLVKDDYTGYRVVPRGAHALVAWEPPRTVWDGRHGSLDLGQPADIVAVSGGKETDRVAFDSLMDALRYMYAIQMMGYGAL
jgi:hypothetical protein